MASIWEQARKTLKDLQGKATTYLNAPIQAQGIGNRNVPQPLQPVRNFGNAAINQVRTDVTRGIPAAFRVAAPAFGQIQDRQNGLNYWQSQGRQATDMFNTAKLVSYALGAPKLATKAGAMALTSSGILGGGLSKAMGGSFAEGAGQGVGMTPSILGITGLTNPLIEKGVNKFAPAIANNISKLPLNNYLSSALVRGLGNIPEGAVIDASLGRRPLGWESVGLDFATGLLGKSAPVRGSNVDDLIKKGKALGIKGVNPEAFILHPEDRDVLAEIGGALGKRPLTDFQERSLVTLYQKYMPGVNIDTVKPAKLKKQIAWLMDINNQIPKGQRQEFPGMGFVQKGQPQAVGDIMDGGFKPGSGFKEEAGKSKYSFNINKDNLQMNNQQKAQLDEVVSRVKPELEKIKGKPLTFDEVRNEAKKADILQKAVGREQTAQYNASLLATREKMTTLNNEIDRMVKDGNTAGAERLTQELVEVLRVVSGASADAGRKLGSFRIMAEERPFREQLIEDMIKTQKFTDDQISQLTKEAAKVDFNNPKQVQDFYKKFVKPTIFDRLEELRYFNLLSSPLTHVVNITSNAIQTAVTRPVTKLVSGAIDPIASALTGKQRENYIAEVPVYYRGMFASMPEAFNNLKKVFTGEAPLTNIDLRNVQKGRALSSGNVVSKSLEGMDQFFRTLVEGAEREAFGYKFAKQGTEVAQADVDNLAKQAGEYAVFRQGLKQEGQGAVLDWFDKGTEAVLGLRRVPGVSWFVPFVQTPMNILKQGFEYSPAGFATTIGAANKREQTAKAIVGSSVFLGAGYLAMQDRLTYAAPKDPTQKKNFYAAGMQPYSVKIGDKWVSYSKLGPLAYPFALAAATKYAFKDNPKAAAEPTEQKVLNALLGSAEFFGDQSYLQGIGNIINAFEGQEGYNVTKVLSSIPSQYIPAASLQRWVNGIIDPVYRKPEGVVENLASNIVGMTKNMGYYETPSGEPSKRQYPIGNALNPFRTTKENPEYKDSFESRQSKLQTNAVFNKSLKPFEQLDSQIKSLVQAGEVEQARELILKNQDVLVKGEESKKFKSQFDEYYSDLDKVSASNQLTPEQKQQIITIIKQRIDLLNKAYSTFQSQGYQQ